MAEEKIPEKFQDLVKKIEELTVSELAELVKILEEKFGVSAVPMAVAGAAPSSGAGETAADQEPSTVSVILQNAGSAKIQVIKALREITGLGLKEAKDLVDGAPKPVKEGIKKEEAEEIAKKLKEAGATVEIK